MRRAAVTLALAALVTGCGGTANADASVKTTVTSYFTALRHADSRGACRMLTDASREKLGEFGHDVLKTRDDTCAAAMTALFKSVAGPRLRRLPPTRITKVTRDGDRATAHVKGIDGPIKLEHTKDGWRIDSEPAVEPDKAGAPSDGH